MFAPKKQNVAVLAEGLKVVGSITSDGVVKVYGEVDGDMRCASIVVSREARIAGNMVADHVELDGRMDGPILCGEIVLKSNAAVTGDIACESVMIEKGAFMEGRLIRRTNGHALPTSLTPHPGNLLEGETVPAANGHARTSVAPARARNKDA